MPSFAAIVDVIVVGGVGVVGVGIVVGGVFGMNVERLYKIECLNLSKQQQHPFCPALSISALLALHWEGQHFCRYLFFVWCSVLLPLLPACE